MSPYAAWVASGAVAGWEGAPSWEAVTEGSAGLWGRGGGWGLGWGLGWMGG